MITMMIMMGSSSTPVHMFSDLPLWKSQDLVPAVRQGDGAVEKARKRDNDAKDCWNTIEES
jgi:hypothetical protein